MTTSGRASLYRRTTCSMFVRSYSRRRGTKIVAGEYALSFSTTRAPRKPAPPVTVTRLPAKKLMMSCHRRIGSSHGLSMEIGIHHHSYELAELYLRRPSEGVLRLIEISAQYVYFSRTVVPWINFYIFLPIEILISECLVEEFPD